MAKLTVALRNDDNASKKDTGKGIRITFKNVPHHLHIALTAMDTVHIGKTTERRSVFGLR